MRTIQSLLKNVDHGLVRGFGLFVDSACPSLCRTPQSYGDLMRDPEASDYVRPREFADLEVCYPAECFCFDQFGEVVSDYQKEDLLPRRHREFPYYVDAPLYEGPW